MSIVEKFKTFRSLNKELGFDYKIEEVNHSPNNIPNEQTIKVAFGKHDSDLDKTGYVFGIAYIFNDPISVFDSYDELFNRAIKKLEEIKDGIQ